MGKGVDAARSFAPEHAALIDDMKEQLLIAFLRRLIGKDSGTIVVPIAEVDATGPYTLAFRVDFEKRNLIFTLGQKQ